MFVRFMRRCWVHLSVPWPLSGSFGVIRVRRGGRQAHSLLLGTLGCTVCVVGFIRGRCLHSHTPLGSLGSFAVVVFIRVRPGGHQIHWRVLGLFRCTLGVVGSLGVVGFIGGDLVHSSVPCSLSGSFGVVVFIGMPPWCRRVHSVSLGSFGCALGVVGLIWRHWVHSGAPWVLSGSFGVVGFIQVRPGGCRIHSGALGLFGCAFGVVGFIGGRLVQLSAP